jgi:hypothetical protein
VYVKERGREIRLPRALTWTVAGAALLGVFLIFVYYRPSTTFNVTATSERVEMVSGAARPPSRWVLDNVQVAEGRGGTTLPFSGSFEIADSVKVLIQRVSTGTLWVNVRSARPGRSTGRYFSAAERPLRAAPDEVNIFVPNLSTRADSSRTVLLALFGEVWAGRPVLVNTRGSTAILRSGKVTLIGRSIFGSDRFEAGSVELDAGDVIEVVDPDGPARGFVLVDERPALTVAFQAQGRRMTITRPGGGTYPLSASVLQRIVRDRLSQAVSLLVAVLVAFTTLRPFGADVGARLRRPCGRHAARRETVSDQSEA